MAKLLSSLSFAALLIYSPRGQTAASVNSRNVCYRIKQGDPTILALAADRTLAALATHFGDFLGSDVTLIPAPRSAPLYRPDAFWPGKLVCDAFLARGLGKEILPCLRRTIAVQKSAVAAPGRRPDVEEHLASMDLDHQIIWPSQVTIVDDVLTRGATLLAAASLIAAAAPATTIRAFALVRTKGLLPEVDRTLEPTSGIITFSNGVLDRQP